MSPPARGLISHDAAPSVPGAMAGTILHPTSIPATAQTAAPLDTVSQLLCLFESCLFRCLRSFLPGMHRPNGGPRQHYRPDGSRRRTAGELAKRAARAAARAAQAPDAPAIAQAADGVVTMQSRRLLRRRPLPLRMKVLLYRFCDRCPPIKMVGPLSKADSGKGPGSRRQRQ